MQRIAVIGAGSAGLDFALRCVHSGFEVVLEDVMPSRLRRAEQAHYILHAATDPGAPPAILPGAPSVPTASSSERVGSHDASPGTLHLVSTVEDAVRSADIAIDFVPDELESKLEIFSLLDRMAPPHTILCTPTTALSIADLASCTYRPDRCFALQFADTHATLIHPLQAQHEITASVEEWLRKLGFSVTVTEDRTEPMLVANRSQKTDN